MWNVERYNVISEDVRYKYDLLEDWVHANSYLKKYIQEKGLKTSMLY